LIVQWIGVIHELPLHSFPEKIAQAFFIDYALAAQLREHLKELPYEVMPYTQIRVIARSEAK